MKKHVHGMSLGILGTIAIVGRLSLAQTPTPTPTPVPTWIPDIKFASGREVVPYLEGWIKNPDESFDFSEVLSTSPGIQSAVSQLTDNGNRKKEFFDGLG